MFFSLSGPLTWAARKLVYPAARLQEAKWMYGRGKRKEGQKERAVGYEKINGTSALHPWSRLTSTILQANLAGVQ